MDAGEHALAMIEHLTRGKKFQAADKGHWRVQASKDPVAAWLVGRRGSIQEE
jgi:hypothetical protein